MTAVTDAVTRLAREESGHVLALLASRFHDLDLADESVQEALIEALRWTEVPENPAAWLYTVARNRAIDRIRRAAAAERRERRAATDRAVLEHARSLGETGEEEPEMIVDEADVGDEHLRLVLLCCHPALGLDAQVALTLKLVGGLTTAEIAAAFLLPEPTLAQRIVRAKRKIREAGIPLSIPADLDGRVDALLRVLYLVFNEGYLSRGTTGGARVDLVEQAIRLTIQAVALLPADPEVEGLLALELYARARIDARFDGDDLVLLEDQDRSRWDLELIEQANGVLDRAMRRSRPGPFQVQAVIARYHANARTAGDTDWPAIASAYARLETMTPSPIVALNRAVAIAMADGAPAGLAALERVSGLDEYHLYWAARAELLLRSGAVDAAASAFARARALAVNPAEQRHLDRRISRLDR
ncbi:RNA polymerase sigma-70 factor, ECF subfamily [Rathayibacter oskolensis]|uniref:RNA polymerase sigma-70 factor, ECF subfamily n=1 Tax=Rathayibacter oskolensis TaxID=1891671 RepID=A0A1X7N5Q4_9MICO|nr:sigma-70 family RNA polymerase sigma factor [Rathayibacter oskolensis]SMH32231.1 RNA polymerase sigma-70 factor, ECF subfamily [Rathayibacter oskolensis]